MLLPAPTTNTFHVYMTVMCIKIYITNYLGYKYKITFTDDDPNEFSITIYVR